MGSPDRQVGEYRAIKKGQARRADTTTSTRTVLVHGLKIAVFKPRRGAIG